MGRTFVVDLGSSSVKCGLVDTDGRLLRRAGAPLAVRLDGPLAELDLEALCATVGEATAKVAPVEVDVVVTTGQMGSHVWVDRYGRGTGPAVLWTDRRDMTAGTALLDGMETGAYYRVTGQRWPGLAARLQWGVESVRAGVPVPLRQWMLHRLTGSWGIDPTDASTTGCLAIADASWSEEICQQLGVRPADLLPVLLPDEAVGAVDANGAALLGVPRGTPVLAGAGDGPCASLGAAATGSVGCLTLGSSGTVRLLVDTVALDPSRSATCLAFGSGKYVVSLPTSNVGIALEWACRALGFAKVRELSAAAAAASGDASLAFLPYLTGERFPYWDRDRTAGFVGLRADHDRRDLARSVLMGVACSLRRCVDHVEAMGLALTELRVNGGAAGCELLVSLLAGLVDVPIARSDGETLTGAAVLAGVPARSQITPVAGEGTQLGTEYEAWLSRH